jgi:signal transduction histidine kinase
MVRAYIRAEAEREFARGINEEFVREEVVIRAFPSDVMAQWQLEPVGIDIFGLEIGSFFFTAQPQITPSPRVRVRGSYGDSEPVDFFVTVNPQPRRSIINAEMIVIDRENEIIFPVDSDDAQRAVVQFLADYYAENSHEFHGERMKMVSGETGGAFYLRSFPEAAHSDRVSVLLYSDVSPAIDFMNSMNRMLGILLVISGIAGLITSLIISARFKKSISGLCDYAETIGHGNFDKNPCVFKDSEFALLSTSMENMSNMLQLYEDAQKKFFENASHELRTPLMSIKGYAEGILEDVFCKNEAAQIILYEGEKMTDLVSGILYMSRHGEISETISTVDVKNLIFDCYEKILPIANKFEKKIIINALSISIDTDEERLERVITNVLSNAIRHAKNEVRIDSYVSDENLEIEIRDDGNGINPKDFPHIFKRFYKGENGNIGLGLSICQEIIKSLNGKITARNSDGQSGGAVFNITIPFER